MKKKLRKIVVDGSIYVWGFSPGDIQAGKGLGSNDIFIAYAKNNHTSPLRIEFDIWEQHTLLRKPPRTGLPTILNDPSIGGINLYTPKWAAMLIREGLKQGWQPNARSPRLIIENGTELLLQLQSVLLDEVEKTAKAIASQYLEANKNWKSEDYFLETIKREGTSETPIVVVHGIHRVDTQTLQRGGSESVQLWIDIQQRKLVQELAYQ